MPLEKGSFHVALLTCFLFPFTTAFSCPTFFSPFNFQPSSAKAGFSSEPTPRLRTALWAISFVTAQNRILVALPPNNGVSLPPSSNCSGRPLAWFFCGFTDVSSPPLLKRASYDLPLVLSLCSSAENSVVVVAFLPVFFSYLP